MLGRPVELLVADHQNKADIGATIAREWADQASVGLIIDIGHSAVALAVQEIVREKNRIAIYTSVGDDQDHRGVLHTQRFSRGATTLMRWLPGLPRRLVSAGSRLGFSS